MFPLRLEIATPEPRRFDLRVARVPSISPALVAISSLAALNAASRSAGPQGLDAHVRYRLGGAEDLVLEQSFDGDQAALESVLWLFGLTAFLEQNRWQEVEIEGIEVELRQFEEPRTAELIGAHASSTLVHPGDELQLQLELQAWRGERFRHEVRLRLPSGLPEGPYFLLVGDGATIDAARFALERRRLVALPQALGLLSSLHSRRDVVVLGVLPDQGLAVAGEVLPRLPGSLQSVWSAAATGSAEPLALAIAQQHAESMSRPLRGGVRIALEVEKQKPLSFDETPEGASGADAEAGAGETEEGEQPDGSSEGDARGGGSEGSGQNRAERNGGERS